MPLTTTSLSVESSQRTSDTLLAPTAMSVIVVFTKVILDIVAACTDIPVRPVSINLTSFTLEPPTARPLTEERPVISRESHCEHLTEQSFIFDSPLTRKSEIFEASITAPVIMLSSFTRISCTLVPLNAQSAIMPFCTTTSTTEAALMLLRLKAPKATLRPLTEEPIILLPFISESFRVISVSLPILISLSEKTYRLPLGCSAFDITILLPLWLEPCSCPKAELIPEKVNFIAEETVSTAPLARASMSGQSADFCRFWLPGPSFALLSP